MTVNETISPDIFMSGATYDDYRNRILAGGGIMRDLLDASERVLARTPVDGEPFRRLPRPLRVLVLSEDWCGDCTDNLPILNRLAVESGKLDVRIVSRDEHPAIMDRHLKDGHLRSIPLILFLDDGGSVIGALKERPDSVTVERARRRDAIYAAHPEFGEPHGPPDQVTPENRAALMQALMAMRDEVRPWAIGEVVKELTSIVEHWPAIEDDARRSRAPGAD